MCGRVIFDSCGHTWALSIRVASGSLVNNMHQEKPLYYVCRPVFPPVLKRDDGDVRGRASISGSWRQSRERVRLTLCLLTSTGNRAICSVPIPSCPLKRLQMYSAPICHLWECGGVSSYVPTSTEGTTPPLRGVSAPPEVTLLPYYSFIPSAWWIIMLLPYLVCCGNHTHASIAHAVAFHLCACLLLIDLLSALVNWTRLNSLNRIPV